MAMYVPNAGDYYFYVAENFLEIDDDAEWSTISPSEINSIINFIIGDETEKKSLCFVLGPDDITGDDDTDLRVVLSCGHTADPVSVCNWVKSQSQGVTTFHCPAYVEYPKTCDKELSYGEIRKILLHVGEDINKFDENMAKASAKQYCEYKHCPGCNTIVERKNQRHLCVCCTICKAKKKKDYQFCWQCLKPWRGQGASSEKCSNEGCNDHRLDILRECTSIDLPYGDIKECPSVRACPTCGLLIEHKERCKYIPCKQCKTNFCFVCLESKENCTKARPNNSFYLCAKPMAPRQTSCPVWCKQNLPTEICLDRAAGNDHFGQHRVIEPRLPLLLQHQQLHQQRPQLQVQRQQELKQLQQQPQLQQPQQLPQPPELCKEPQKPHKQNIPKKKKKSCKIM